MNFIQMAVQKIKTKLRLSYHRHMAKMYRQAAATYADAVIHTVHRPSKGSLAVLRNHADMHAQKAKAIRIGE